MHGELQHCMMTAPRYLEDICTPHMQPRGHEEVQIPGRRSNGGHDQANLYLRLVASFSQPWQTEIRPKGRVFAVAKEKSGRVPLTACKRFCEETACSRSVLSLRHQG